MAIYCNQCGTVLPHSARFCSKCGGGVPAAVYGMPTKRLVRPLMGRQIAGVCIGLSQTYGWDVAAWLGWRTWRAGSGSLRRG
jgi:hypothetical protein